MTLNPGGFIKGGMNTPETPEDMLLESERKELFGRITEYIGGKFREMTTQANRRWTGKEIATFYDIQNTHVTEFKNYKKYKREVSYNELSKLIVGGLVTTKELMDKCAKTEKEKAWIKEKFKLLYLAEKAKQHGYDAAEWIEEKLKSEGVDIED